jgi:hypothetical protein
LVHKKAIKYETEADEREDEKLILIFSHFHEYQKYENVESKSVADYAC